MVSFRARVGLRYKIYKLHNFEIAQIDKSCTTTILCLPIGTVFVCNNTGNSTLSEPIKQNCVFP